MKYTSTVAAAAALLPSAANALVGLTWHFPNSPSNGTPDVTFPISVPAAPHAHGMYFAQQFEWAQSNSSQIGYTGLQPQVDSNGKSVIRALFSTFYGGSTTNDPNCSLGADSGDGVSCAVYITETYAGTYNLEVKNIGGNTWQGTAYHDATGTATHIGTFTIPTNLGGLYGYEIGFVEYFPWNSEENVCNKLPFTSVTFGVPTTSVASAGAGAYLAAPYEYGSCVGKVNFKQSDVNGAKHVEVGFPGN